ncbi:flavin-dependent dehydrogenase [Synechocystis sp. LKSZ1]|uniref:NAD(P)/FAD-dependent oxidoreductase n=1 Tax=Synechocystis sp. LKSZ1 TaxID=3144951 RepID=UPI00336C0511
MQEFLYLEVPTPDTGAVLTWLQQTWSAPGLKRLTADGLVLSTADGQGELSIFIWSLQRTTYLKVFRWGSRPFPQETTVVAQLKQAIETAFPPQYPALPDLDLSQGDIFTALAPYYPQTVHFFQKFPQGAYDLQRVYWWEKRWRDNAQNPQHPPTVIVDHTQQAAPNQTPDYDLIYIGGALGVIHAAVMAQRGYRVLLIERMPFGRMNREWNISRGEFQRLIDLGLFTPEEFEALIAREYQDGFNKFFDAYNPPHLKAKVLHTPRVLNIALNSAQLLQRCGEKLRAAGGDIWDETEFLTADVYSNVVTLSLKHLPTDTPKTVSGRLLIDAMGTASPIAWQLNGRQAFSSVCPTVGAVVEGLAPEVWDATYGDVLNSHGDISRGRQLIWELFPGAGDEMTIYLFHYHQVHPQNPGSLLEMYEDFFMILPEYRRCDPKQLTWKKATFGYIPGHFSTSDQDRTVAYDRLLAIGDAASLQSPLVFTGFGSLVRNLGRLTDLLDVALRHDLLKADHLNGIRAYQSNIAVTWLFSKGMMVPTGKTLPPQRINAMLNTFFGLLADSPPEVADTFIKDRTTWGLFTRLALKAARQNPRLLLWIWQMAGTEDLLRWLLVYVDFSRDALAQGLLFWLPQGLNRSRPWLEAKFPALWLRLLSFRYRLAL